jgi:hypothetical protein
LSAGAVRASLIRIRRAVAACVFIDLRLGRVQKHKQARVVCLAIVINQGVEQIRCIYRRASWKVRRASSVERDCISTVLQAAVIENQIHARN